MDDIRSRLSLFPKRSEEIHILRIKQCRRLTTQNRERKSHQQAVSSMWGVGNSQRFPIWRRKENMMHAHDLSHTRWEEECMLRKPCECVCGGRTSEQKGNSSQKGLLLAQGLEEAVPASTWPPHSDLPALTSLVSQVCTNSKQQHPSSERRLLFQFPKDSHPTWHLHPLYFLLASLVVSLLTSSFLPVLGVTLGLPSSTIQAYLPLTPFTPGHMSICLLCLHSSITSRKPLLTSAHPYTLGLDKMPFLSVSLSLSL